MKYLRNISPILRLSVQAVQVQVKLQLIQPPRSNPVKVPRPAHPQPHHAFIHVVLLPPHLPVLALLRCTSSQPDALVIFTHMHHQTVSNLGVSLLQ